MGGDAQQRDGVHRSGARGADLGRARRLCAVADHLVYAVLLGVTLAEMVVLAWIAETASRKAGAWSGIRPKLTVPAAATGEMVRLFPLTLRPGRSAASTFR